jgi:hypothetical protein
MALNGAPRQGEGGCGGRAQTARGSGRAVFVVEGGNDLLVVLAAPRDDEHTAQVVVETVPNIAVGGSKACDAPIRPCVLRRLAWRGSRRCTWSRPRRGSRWPVRQTVFVVLSDYSAVGP